VLFWFAFGLRIAAFGFLSHLASSFVISPAIFLMEPWEKDAALERPFPTTRKPNTPRSLRRKPGYLNWADQPILPRIRQRATIELPLTQMPNPPPFTDVFSGQLPRKF